MSQKANGETNAEDERILEGSNEVSPKTCLDFCDAIPRDVELFETNPPAAFSCDDASNQHTIGTNDQPDISVPVLSDDSDVEAAGVYDNQSAVADDSAVTSEFYQRALQEAHFMNARNRAGQLPWESGVFSTIFADGSDVDFFLTQSDPLPGSSLAPVTIPDREMQIDVDPPLMTAKNKRGGDVRIFTGVVKSLSDKDFDEQIEQLWNRALNKWLVIFSCMSYSGVVGKEIEKLIWAGADPIPVLRDVLGVKAPKTVNKRAGTLMAFFNWVSDQSVIALPLDPALVRSYLDNTVERGKSSSKGKTLLETFRFAKFVMRMEGFEDVLDDPILSGRASRMSALQKTVKQARPLSVDEVKKLECFLTGSRDPFDKYLVGCILFAIFSRSRWSDLAQLDSLQLDVTDTREGPFGFVEGRTRHHKTGSSAIKKSMQMPLVSPIAGVSSCLWALIWFEVMDSIGFQHGQEPLGALCRAPHDDGLNKRSLTSEEAAAFANALLEVPDDSLLHSHSFKCTTLSWCAKFGMDEPSRTLLGHHELGSQSLAAYSRDMLARPLQKYQVMLSCIRKRTFLPDVSRSGWVASRHEIQNDSDSDVVLEEHTFPKDDTVDDSAHLVTTQRLEALTVKSEGCEASLPSAPGDFFDSFGGGDDLLRKAFSDGSFEKLEHVGDSELNAESVFVRSKDELGVDRSPATMSDETSSSDSSSSTSDAAEEDLQNKCGAVLPFKDIQEPCYQHNKSRVLHRPSKREGVLACGRRVGSTYKYLASGASLKWARCSGCFRGEVLTNVDQIVDAFDRVRQKRQGQSEQPAP